MTNLPGSSGRTNLRAQPPTLRASSRWIGLIALSLSQLMVILDSTIVNIALPAAQHELGFSDADRQWIVTGYALAFGSLLLFGGRMSDLFGQKRLLTIGIVGFALASAIGGAAPGFGLLLAARIGQGIFAALLAPAALALVSVTFSDNAKERGRAFGILGAVAGAGGAVGLLLGGLLTQTVSWRWCLYVNIVIAILALIGAAFSLRDGNRAARVRLDVPGTIAISLGLVALVYGLGNAATVGWVDWRTITFVLVGLSLVALFILIERRAASPLLPLRVLLDRNRGAAFAAVGIAGIGSFAMFLFLTYFLQENLGFTPIQTGIGFLPMVGMIIASSAIAVPALMPRLGPRLLVPLGCLMSAAAMALLASINDTTHYASGVLPALLLFGFGLGLIFGPAQNAATSGTASDEAGIASALVNTAQQIGGSIGTAVFSALASAASATYLAAHAAAGSHVSTTAAALVSYHLVFWVSSATLLAGGILAAVMFRSGPLSVETPTAPAHEL